MRAPAIPRRVSNPLGSPTDDDGGRALQFFAASAKGVCGEAAGTFPVSFDPAIPLSPSCRARTPAGTRHAIDRPNRRQLMFLKDCWYVAAWGHELDGGKLIGRTL